MRGNLAGLMVKISHRGGFVTTDSTWKVSTQLAKIGTRNALTIDRGVRAELGKLGESLPGSLPATGSLPGAFPRCPVHLSSEKVQEDQMIYFRKEFLDKVMHSIADFA